MEDIAPPLACLFEMQQALRNGEPARAGVARWLRESEDDFARDLKRALFAWDQGADWRPEAQKMRSPYRRAVCDALMRSLGGQSVQARLEELRGEIELACDLEIRRHVDLLPLRAMMPLLLLEFPAFLLLIFGPLMSQLMEEVSR